MISPLKKLRLWKEEMMIRNIVIHNYKLFEDFELPLNEDLNIIVGDNETGKSTILEAINLALTKKLNGRYIESELSPFLFNFKTVANFLQAQSNEENPDLPEIFIELYFNDDPELAKLKGSNNSKREDCAGVRLEITFDDDFKEEYENLLEEELSLIPVEYYKVNWRSFADTALTSRSIPIGLSFIDATTIRLQSGTDYYLQNIINDGLDPKERVALTVAYRRLKEDFAKKESILAINKKLDNDKGSITDKDLAIRLDVSQKSSWETNLVPHLDEIPFHYSGKGEQSSLKIMLALEKKVEDTNIILIEEPENHLSYSSMHGLLKKIISKCDGKQIVISTHDSYVLNKLGMDKLILIQNCTYTKFENLPQATQNYFKKLSGYDTLRLILAKKAILVEGPSDELFVQKAYKLEHGRLPIEDGVDVINVRGLSFKRFLDIAKELEAEVSVVTDNDGDYQKNIEEKYKEYSEFDNIKIHYDKDNKLPSLEQQIVNVNTLDDLNSILNTQLKNKDNVIEYMTSSNNKTECALRFFDTNITFVVPEYVKSSVK